MFRSWRPLAWMIVAAVAFYAYAFKLFPLWTTAILAAGCGVTMSIALGSWIRESHVRRREDWEFAEMIRRESAEEDAREQADARADSINETGDRDG